MPPLCIAGLQKTSLIDFPGKVSCVIFLTGCNFKCPYCHNPDLANGQYPARISMPELIDSLAQRQALLDGVVVTGGEPTLWAELPELCRHFHQMGLAVKLDTNGSRPDMIKALIQEGLVDYIAMDLKTDPDDYGPPWCPDGSGSSVRQSLQLIMTGGVDYEFRTTCAPGFVDEARIGRMASAIEGARRYILQNFNPMTVLDPGYCESFDCSRLSGDRMHALHQLAAPLVATCSIR